MHLKFSLSSLWVEQDKRVEEGGEMREQEGGGLICLQTRNGVHAEIARGSGLESAAASVYTVTFAPFHSVSVE